MGSPDFSLGQDDGGVPWDEVLKDFNGSPINLAGGSAEIQFQLQDQTQPVIGGPCSIVDGINGKARYTFPTPQTGVPGLYNASFIGVTAGGEQITWPPDRYLELKILRKLDTPNVPWAGYWGLAFLSVPSVGVGTAGVNLGAHQLVAFNSVNQLILADNTDATKQPVGITIASANASQPCSFVTRGPIYSVFTGRLPGQPLFLGTAGALTAVAPTNAGNLQMLVGYALNATDLYVHLTNWGTV